MVKEIGKRRVIKIDSERPVRDRTGRSQIVIQAEILIPGLDTYATETLARKRIDNSTSNLVSHRSVLQPSKRQCEGTVNPAFAGRSNTSNAGRSENERACACDS